LTLDTPVAIVNDMEETPMRKPEWNSRIQAKQTVIGLLSNLSPYAPEHQYLARVWGHINAPLFADLN
jgi:hypothetical protein